MSVKTFNQLSTADKDRARELVRDQVLGYLYQSGIPLDPNVLPPEPQAPFTKIDDWLEMNQRVQQLQLANSALLWITEFLKDDSLADALEREIDARLQDVRFRTEDTPAENILAL